MPHTEKGGSHVNEVVVTSKEAVRRFLLEQQGLSPKSEPGESAPGDRIFQLLCRLECIQLDPVTAVERNEHLVLAARVPDYSPSLLNRLLSSGRVFEFEANGASVIPMEDYPLFEPTRAWFRRMHGSALARLRSVAEFILKRLDQEGPLPARAFQTVERVRGFWDNRAPKTKATSHVLNLLVDIGEIMVVRREGGERYFDLVHRMVPPDLLRKARDIDHEAADAGRLKKYLRAYRIFDTGDWRFGWHRLKAQQRRAVIQQAVRAGEVVPIHVEGVRRRYFMLTADVERLRRHEHVAPRERSWPEGPVRFLPPLDNLLWRRERIEDFFDFRYVWEIYMPAHRRQYGYYAMPILAGDRFVGRMDPRLDREQGRLVVHLLQIEAFVRPSRQFVKNLRAALMTFGEVHGAREVVIGRTDPDGLRI